MKKIKTLIKKSCVLTKIYRMVNRIILTIIWNMRFLINRIFKCEELYACCFVFTTMFGKLRKYNWGDDLNVFLFPLISKRKIIYVPFSKLLFFPKVERYLLIGSIIEDFNLDNAIIYGTGAISEFSDIKGVPSRVLSVRGPLTRDVLLKKGCFCPKTYGDPALLCPLVYNPKKEKRNCIGVIPHYKTGECDWINALKKEHYVVEIDMSNYEKWTDIIDLVVSCNIIISESLHGIIISEAYKIPSVWVEFIPHDYPWEWEFKYLDFYKSIGKEDEVCYKVYNGLSHDDIIAKAERWKEGRIDYKSMLQSFPFEIKDTLLENEQFKW